MKPSELADAIMDTGTVLVAIIIVAGLVVLNVLNRPTDGLETGLVAVLAFFYGGGLVSRATTKAGKTSRDIVSVVNKGRESDNGGTPTP